MLTSAEHYDPATGTWTPTGSMATRRALHVAQLLPSGKVLVAGGRTCDAPPPTCNSTFTTNTFEVYDPATGLWTPTTSMSNNRTTTSAVLLTNGTVMVPAGFPGGQVTSETYDPSTGTWTYADTRNVPRARQGAMLLPDGDVIVAAGSIGAATQTSETYDLATNTWTVAGNVAQNRFTFFFTELPNGKVLIAGGASGATASTTAEVYDPVTRTWSSAGTLPTAFGSSSSNGNSTRMVVLRHPGTVRPELREGAAGGRQPGRRSCAVHAGVLVRLHQHRHRHCGQCHRPGRQRDLHQRRLRDRQHHRAARRLAGGQPRHAGGRRHREPGLHRCPHLRLPDSRRHLHAGTVGPVVVGDGTAACPRNDIVGQVSLDGNNSVELDTNRVSGGVSVTNTSGSPQPAVIAANQITVDLACAGNVPPPTNEGRPNAVLGARTGQCAAL